MSREPQNEDEERLRQRKLEEVKSLRRIVSAYLNYPDAADSDVKRSERSFEKLPLAHKALLSHYPLKFKRLRRCISANSQFIYNMLQEFEPPIDMSQDMDTREDPHCGDAPNEHGFVGAHDVCSFHSASTSGRGCFSESDQACCVEDRSLGNTPTKRVDPNKEVENEGHSECDGECKNLDSEGKKDTETCCGNDPMDSHGNAPSSNKWLDQSLRLNVPLADVDKVRCIIRNVVRDWAAEGQKERDQCYNPILEELEALFPNRSKEIPPACLVPGAGLGRLALEISRLGFVSQGNEFSYYMMICSSFILNNTQQAEEWELYPWIHSNCNSRSENDQLRSVLIPDIHPASAGITEGFSMCGGDFVEVYGDPKQTGITDLYAYIPC